MTFTDEPAVLTWMVALSPRPRPEPSGRHWWREMVHDHWIAATHAWELHRERVALGYATEERDFESEHPRPRFRDFLEAMSSGRLAPCDPWSPNG